MGINDSGDVAGRVFEDLVSQNSESKAVLWHLDDTGYVTGTTDIPHVSDQKHWSSAWTVNETASHAIGMSCEVFRMGFKPKVYVPQNCVPFLWHDGQTSALNDLISDFDGFTELTTDADMNAAGWICGRGVKNEQPHAYVAIPSP